MTDEGSVEPPPPAEPGAGWLGHVALELRSRVAAAVAAVQGLSDPTVRWDEEQRRELLSVAGGSLQDVTLLVQELATVGARTGFARDADPEGTPLRDLLGRATAELGQGRRPSTHVPASLPSVVGDPGLVGVVLASLLRHALRSADTPHPDVRAVCRDHRVLIRVSGRPPSDRRWAAGLRRALDPVAWDQDVVVSPDLTVARGLARLLGGALHADPAGDDAAVVLDLPAAPVTPV